MTDTIEQRGGLDGEAENQFCVLGESSCCTSVIYCGSTDCKCCVKVLFLLRASTCVQHVKPASFGHSSLLPGGKEVC